VERDGMLVILDDARRVDRRPDLLQPRRARRQQQREEEDEYRDSRKANA
jgi:hypothetical protein